MPAGDTYTILTQKVASGPEITLRFEAREDGGFNLVADIKISQEENDLRISSSMDPWQANRLGKWLQHFPRKVA